MKHIGNELNVVLSTRRIKKKVFAEKLGMSDVNLSKVLKKDSVDAELLERITNLLQLPINFWFDENVTLNSLKSNPDLKESLSTDSNQCDAEINFLRTLLAEKERTIQILMRSADAEKSPIIADPNDFFKTK